MKTRVKRLLFCLSLLPAWLNVEEDIDHLFSLSLEALLAVEVSGAAFSVESLANTPASVTVFTAKEIQQLGMRYVYELANLVPGFQAKRQGLNAHLYSISSRGRQVSSLNTNIIVIINGQAVTSAYTGSSMAVIWTIPLENVSKVEFIRGPGSLVYGSGALLGIINIETYQVENYGQMALGNSVYGASAVNYSQAGVQFSAIFRGDQGQRYSLKDGDRGKRINSQDPYSEGHMYLTLHSDDSALSLHHHRFSDSGFYTFDHVDNDINGFDQQYTSATVRHVINHNTAFDLTMSAFFNIYRCTFSGRSSAPGVLEEVSNPSSSEALHGTSVVKANQYGVKLVSDWLLAGNHLVFGGEYQYSPAVSGTAFANFSLNQIFEGNFPVDYYDNNSPGESFLRKQENQSLALFGEYQQHITEDLTATYSLRYDYAKNIDDGELLPRIALIYTLNANHGFKAIHSQAFRHPDANELDAINNSISIGNVNLSPETVRSNEVIWFVQHPQFYFNLAYFHNKFNNAIVQVTDQARRVFQNIGEESNAGFEVEYRHELSKNFSVRTSVARMTNHLGSAIRISENSGSFTLSWHEARWQANVMSVYQSQTQMFKNEDQDILTLPSFWVLNMSVNYLHGNNTQSQLLINNVLDDRYFSPAISTVLDEGIPSRGRELNHPKFSRSFTSHIGLLFKYTI